MAAFLDASSDAGTLVFSGEPGIGKTTLWQVGLEMAAERGFQVLSTRASPGEAGLLFAALADLMEGIDAEVLGRLPAPQLHALEVALRRRAPDPVPPEPLAISAGLVAAIRSLVLAADPLIAIDDVQWLDPSSADCLLFLARRVSGQVRWLLSRRSYEISRLEQALEPGGVTDVEVEGLSVGAIGRLLSDRLGLVVPRRVLHRIYDASQGNPLFALELGRTILEAGLPDVSSDLPAPKLVDEAFAARVDSLPESQRRALLAVALSAGLTRSELGAVVDPLTVEDALDAGLISSDRGRMRPAHPMLAAAARKRSTAADRRDLHLALAREVADPVLSARHLGLASQTPDAVVADKLAAAARLAIDRGALHEAEELSAHALRLTPAGSAEETDRLFDLARCHLSAGDLRGAASLLEGRVEKLPSGRSRGLGHLLLGEAVDGFREEAELDLALNEAGDDRDLRAIALARKATLLAVFRVRRLAEAEELARQAQSISEGTEHEDRARLALAWALLLRGRRVDQLGVEPGRRPSAGYLFETTIERVVAIQRAFRGEARIGREILVRLAELADERGEARSRLGLSIQLCEFSLRLGQISQARSTIDDLDQWTAIGEMRIVYARLNALIAALRGRPEEVQRWVDQVMSATSATYRAEWDYLEASRAAGLCFLFQDDAPAAAERLDAVWQHCCEEGVEDPGAFPVAGDLVEALVAAGSPGRAAEVTEQLERLSIQLDHPWARVTTRRCRATLVPNGDVEELLATADDYARLGLEFEQARCLLYAGSHQRRSNKRARSRQALQDAGRLFEQLGSDGWAERARSELQRVSGRRATEESQLTPSESRVADLAVRGLSNKEIAQALHVSVYTVEAHLSHVYAKLGVRSRSQLANRLPPAERTAKHSSFP